LLGLDSNSYQLPVLLACDSDEMAPSTSSSSSSSSDSEDEKKHYQTPEQKATIMDSLVGGLEYVHESDPERAIVVKFKCDGKYCVAAPRWVRRDASGRWFCCWLAEIHVKMIGQHPAPLSPEFISRREQYSILELEKMPEQRHLYLSKFSTGNSYMVVHKCLSGIIRLPVGAG
jgi:hypothetical protein